MANAEGVKCVLRAGGAEGGVARQGMAGECEYVLNGLQGAAGKVAQQQQQSSGRRCCRWSQSPKTVHNCRQMPCRAESRGACGMWHGAGRLRNGEYVS